MAMIKQLDQLSPEDALQVGRKAYNCSRLIQAGFSVPDGFVIPDAMSKSFSTDALNEQLARFPEHTLFAVRSSASDEDSKSYSFAGIHETRVNVRAGDILEAVNICRNSVHSPQAIAYCRSQGVESDQFQTGILVQTMIQPLVSGVAFTSNPLTGESNGLLINASWGLGGPLVSGQVEPDEFALRKSDHRLLYSHTGSKKYRMISEKNVSRLIETKIEERQQSTLSSAQLSKLAPLLCDIEAFFGQPQDIEWCFDGSQFWIVQSRPITASAVSKDPDIEWSRANFREVLPDLPSILSEVSLDFLNSSFRDIYGSLLAPETELGPIVKTIHGRPYINITQFRRLCYLTKTPVAVMGRQIGHESKFKPEDEKISTPPLLDSLRALPSIWKLVRLYLSLSKLMDKQHRLNKEDMGFLANQSPKDISNAQIMSFFNRFINSFTSRLAPRITINFGISIHEKCLHNICSKVKFPYERLVHPQMAVGEKSVSTMQVFDLLALVNTAQKEDETRNYFLHSSGQFTTIRKDLENSIFLLQFDSFLEKYGHRGNFESEVSLPLYQEDPHPLFQAIRTHIQAGNSESPDEILARQEEEAKQSWLEFIDKLSPLKRLFFVPITRRSLKRIKQLYICREQDRSDLQRVASKIRQYHLVVAQRFMELAWIDQVDDYFYLKFQEIQAALDDSSKAEMLKPIIAKRKKENEILRHLEMPLHMHDSEAPALMRRAVSKISLDSGQLTGLCVSAGQAEGVVVVIRDPSEFDKMQQGAILVAPATNPAWTPLFTLAAGIIVEIGGTLSHASIVAREYSIPALANVKDAVKLLNDGAFVHLDATNGFVEIV